MLFLLIVAWNTDITIIYIFFVVAFVMFVISFIHLQINIPELTIKRDAELTAFEGELLNVKIEVVNKRGFGIYFFELIDIFPSSPPGEEKKSLFILEMAGKDKKTFSYAAECYKRGLWKIGPISVIAQDGLGFFKFRKVYNIFSEILIYPSLFRIFAFPVLAKGSISWMGVETAKISGDSHEFFGVREYQRGDAMSRIHWPSTARHNKLIVRQFERNALQEVSIVIDSKKGRDIGTGKDTTFEYSIKIAGSIAKYLLNEGVFVQVIGYGKNATIIPFGKGESHMYRILEYLARAQADGDFTLNEVLEEANFVVPYNSTLIVIMRDDDMDAISSLVQFKIKGIKLILVVLSSSTFGPLKEYEHLDADEVKRFDEGITMLEAYVYRISKGDDLEKKFETV